MFCPNCGANNTTEQNFCRSCGLNLEDVAKSLLQQLPSAESAEILRREQRLEKFGSIAWNGFAVVLMLGIGTLIYWIMWSLVWSGKQPFLGILLSAFIIFAGLLLLYVGFKEDLKEKRKKLKQPAKNALGESKTTGKLLEEKPFAAISSVVENSTELFPLENKTRKFE